MIESGRMTAPKPQFTHDCDGCQFLGRHKRGQAHFDLYYCSKGILNGTLLARYGNEGSEYLSSSVDVLLYAGYQSNDPLIEAARRQIIKWREATHTL